MNRNLEGISDRLIIYVNEKSKTYNILDIKKDVVLLFDVKDLETAIEMKKAYCFGYIDRKNEEDKQQC